MCRKARQRAHVAPSPRGRTKDRSSHLLDPDIPLDGSYVESSCVCGCFPGPFGTAGPCSRRSRVVQPWQG